MSVLLLKWWVEIRFPILNARNLGFVFFLFFPNGHLLAFFRAEFYSLITAVGPVGNQLSHLFRPFLDPLGPPMHHPSPFHSHPQQPLLALHKGMDFLSKNQPRGHAKQVCPGGGQGPGPLR